MTHNRKPTPRHDSIEQREQFQMQVFALAVFGIVVATAITCLVHDVRMMRAVDAAVRSSRAVAGW